MRKTYLMGCLIAALASCGSEKTPSITALHGEIKGLGNDTLYLVGSDSFYDRIDTIPVKEDKFQTTLHIDTTIIARLLLANGEEYPLFIDKGEQLHIAGTAPEADSISITGSRTNEELGTFLKELQTLQNPSPRAKQEKAEEFIKSHYTSLASLYVLEKFFVQQPEPDFARLKQLTENMTGELKDRPFLSELLEEIKEEEKVNVGKSAPYFQLTNAKGEKVTRTDFKNKYLLIHFWASWDEESRKANAALRRIYKKEKKNEHFAMLGVSLDLEKETWEEAIEQDTLKWEQTCDFAGWQSKPAEQFCLRRLPYNILLDATGRIQAKDMSEQQILDKIADIKKQEEEKARREKERKAARNKKRS